MLAELERTVLLTFATVNWDAVTPPLGLEAADVEVVTAATNVEAELAELAVVVVVDRLAERTSGDVVGAVVVEDVDEVDAGGDVVGFAATTMLVEVADPVTIREVADVLVTLPPSVRLLVARVTEGPASFTSPARAMEPELRTPLRVVKKFAATEKEARPLRLDTNRPPAVDAQVFSQKNTNTLRPVKSRELSRNRSAPFRKRCSTEADPLGGVVVELPEVCGDVTIS